MKDIIKKIGFDNLIIIAVCGIVLISLSLPGKSSGTSKLSNDFSDNSSSFDSFNYCTRIEDKVKNLIMKFDGIESADVMITLKSDKTDHISASDNLNTEIEGVAVIIKGKYDSFTPLKITNMLLALFQIEQHKISVIGV